MTQVNVILLLLSILGALAIILYATWLFAGRLKRGDQVGPSFAEWLKHLLEAVLGL